ncbi:hypothetical protein ACFX2I_014636 [Malus domestica]
MKRAKLDCVTVQKKFSKDRDPVVTAYEVRDKPSALKAGDWDWVVLVFVLLRFSIRVIMGFFMRFEEDSVESAKIVNPVECEDHLDSLSAMICLSECLPSLLRFNLLTFIFNCISRTLYLPLRTKSRAAARSDIITRRVKGRKLVVELTSQSGVT